MITYYTAVGRLETKITKEGKIPVVINEDREQYLSVDELIMWGSLHWNFLNKDTLFKEYMRRKSEAHIFDDNSFENTLDRLIARNLIAKGTQYLAADALYELLGNLKIRPVKVPFPEKIKSSIYLYFVKGIPFKSIMSVFKEEEITPNEKMVLKLSKNIGVSASEIIRCADNKVDSIINIDDIMDKLYDGDITEDSMKSESLFSKFKTDVLQAVANLYLKKRIVFEN